MAYVVMLMRWLSMMVDDWGVWMGNDNSAAVARSCLGLAVAQAMQGDSQPSSTIKTPTSTLNKQNTPLPIARRKTIKW